jgi:hypothetical protein
LVKLEYNLLSQARTKFGFLNDADDFILKS